MSGYAAPGPNAGWIEAKDFLPKPFTMNELVRRLEAARPAAGPGPGTAER